MEERKEGKIAREEGSKQCVSKVKGERNEERKKETKKDRKKETNKQRKKERNKERALCIRSIPPRIQ